MTLANLVADRLSDRDGSDFKRTLGVFAAQCSVKLFVSVYPLMSRSRVNWVAVKTRSMNDI